MEELWKDITNYEGYYQISNLGRIKSLSRVIKLFNRGEFLSKEIILIPYKTKKGYLRVPLLKNKERKGYLVHRLVAKEFIKNPLNYDQVNHLDGNKANNNIYNLEWCNNSQNSLHSFRLGLQKPKIGANNGYAKKVGKYDMQGNLIEIYDYMSLAAKENNSCIANISSCCHGKRKKVRGHVFKFL